MPVLAIVGAGSGLGLSIARRFGREGYRIALVARDRQKLDGLVSTLAGDGIEAAAFRADVLDATSVVSAFAAIEERFGPVDVLEYSPAPHSPVPGVTPESVLDVTVENLQPQVAYYLYGAVTAAQQVLPAMLERGAGAALFTTGAGSVHPVPLMGNINAAAAALRNWAINLHAAAGERGVYAAHVAIGVFIGDGKPENEPDAIADLYWRIVADRSGAEHTYEA